MTGVAAVWVEQSVSWAWWIGTLLTMLIGGVIGWVARGWWVREQQDQQMVNDAQRAARVYQREIERARRRHPSAR